MDQYLQYVLLGCHRLRTTGTNHTDSRTDTQGDQKVRRASALKAVLILILSSSPQPLKVLILEWTLENTRSSQIKDLNPHINR